jgi:hypothetical protein
LYTKWRLEFEFYAIEGEIVIFGNKQQYRKSKNTYSLNPASFKISYTSKNTSDLMDGNLIPDKAYFNENYEANQSLNTKLTNSKLENMNFKNFEDIRYLIQKFIILLYFLKFFKFYINNFSFRKL